MSLFRAALSLTCVVLLTQSVSAEDWGQAIKGRVVFDGAVPKRVVIDEKRIDNDVKFCLSKGMIQSDDLVVDPKTKGVRWAVAYLIAENGDFTTKLPINPAIKMPEKVVLDQPCCMFEPHVLCMTAKQTLVARNSADVPHNTNIVGVGGNPQLNPLIPAKKEVEVTGWKAYPSPNLVNCTIHKWMSASVFVFDHPYFAVTNEKGEFEIKNPPAGKYRLVVRQSDGIWIAGEPGQSPSKRGMTLEIKKNAITDVGEIKMKPPE